MCVCVCSQVATKYGWLTNASSLPSWCRVQPPPLRRSPFISTSAFRSMISALVSYFHSLQCGRLLIDSRAESALAITNPRNCSGALSSPPVHLPSPLRRARTPARRSASYACLASPAPAPPLPRLGRLVLSHAVRTTSTLLRGLSGSCVSSRKPSLRENSLSFSFLSILLQAPAYSACLLSFCGHRKRPLRCPRLSTKHNVAVHSSFSPRVTQGTPGPEEARGVLQEYKK